MSDDTLIRLHTGAAIGELIDGEDGDQLLVGFDGRIVRGVDADGQEIDTHQLLAE